jgi:hypothetical protein
MRQVAAVAAMGLLGAACFTDIGDVEPGSGGSSGLGGSSSGGVSSGGASGASGAAGGAAGSAAGEAGGASGMSGGGVSGVGGDGACAGSTADCDGNPSNGCETDLATSSSHCGECGHGCLGQPCTMSVCEPIVLATGQSMGYSLVVDGTALYWTRETGSLHKGSINGAAPTTLATGKSFAELGIDAQHLFWVEYGAGSLRRLAKAGGGELALVSGLVLPAHLYVDPSGIFYSDRDAGHVAFSGKDGSSSKVLAAGLEGPRGVAADATHVYFTDTAGALGRIPRTGGAAQIIAKAPAGFYARSLALDATHVYWRAAETGDFPAAEGYLYKLAKSGGELEPIADKEPGARGLTLDATHVYFTSIVSGTVSRVRKDGTGRMLLAKGQKQPHSVAVDEQAVYWINWSGGELMKTGK